ncbi:YfbU family protein [Clavibacter michiganensis subsp. tessellarius]
MALLHHILARVLPEDGSSTDGIGSRDDQLERARVLEDGFTTEYWVEFAGISPELSRRDSHRVMDILDMFRVTGHSMRTLEERGAPLDEHTARTLTYQGFDLNDSLESKMADYVRFLVEDGRWTEQEDFINGPSRGNSHSKNLEIYLRMLAEYRSIAARRIGRDILSADDLTAIAAEAIHPTNRHHSTSSS